MKPIPGTIEYAVWAYQREMDRAEAERIRKALVPVSESA